MLSYFHNWQVMIFWEKNYGIYIHACVLMTHSNLFYELESYCVAQAGLKLLGLSDPPASASQVAGSTGRHHLAHGSTFMLKKIKQFYLQKCNKF
jgi:hypothetical protein